METRPNYKDYILCNCEMCGNKGLHKIVSKYPQVIPEYDEEGQIGEYYNDYYLLECPACYGISLFCVEADSFSYDEYREFFKEKVVFPKNREFRNVPSDIKDLYIAAKKTANINSTIALVSIRSLLEKICKDKGATKKKLVSMLSELSNKGVLPDQLNRCSYLIRKLGNTGAHGDDFVWKNDVLKLIEFIENIMYYLYDLPAEIRAFNERYEELLKETQESEE